MKWNYKYMIDPGDGIVSAGSVEHDSDDIVEVAADLMNGDLKDEDGELITITGWIFQLEAVPD